MFGGQCNCTPDTISNALVSLDQAKRHWGLFQMCQCPWIKCSGTGAEAGPDTFLKLDIQFENGFIIPNSLSHYSQLYGLLIVLTNLCTESPPFENQADWISSLINFSKTDRVP